MKKTLVRIYRFFESKKTEIIEEFLPKYFFWSRFTSILYYFFISKSLHREMQSVLIGKVQYQKNNNSKNSNIFKLIRNIHRLEKGLVMRPRRGVFALDYIEETVDSYIKICKTNEGLYNKQLDWAKDVLIMYFNVVDNNQKIDDLREIFFSINFSNEKKFQNKVPFCNTSKINIDFEQFYQLCRKRRSTRWFESKKVPRELVDKAILAAVQSPSACNRQPFYFRIIDDRDLLDQIVTLPGGTTGWGHNIPMLIVVTGRLDAYFSERDRHVIYIDASLASMSLMFALETLGLSSCSINWPDVESREQKMEKALNLKKFERPIMCLAVGFPDKEGLVPFSEKKDLDIIRFYNLEICT